MRTKLELALIPLSRLNAVLGPAGYAPFTQKADDVSAVNTLIESGRITLDEVKNGTVSIAATSASVIAAALTAPVSRPCASTVMFALE